MISDLTEPESEPEEDDGLNPLAVEAVQRWWKGKPMFPEWASGLLLPADDLLEAFDVLFELFAEKLKPNEAAELRSEAAAALKKLNRVFAGKLIEL